MTSNHSFFKLVREAMRRNIWAAALSLIGFFFCLPLPAVMLIQNRITSARAAGTSRSEQMKFAANDLHTLLGMDNMAVKAGICIMAVLCGIALFSYLHSRQRVDFYHSVPLGRSTLFWINYTTGLLTVLPAFYIMYALAALIGAVMGVPTDAPDSIHASEIVSTLLMHTLFFLLLYTLSALAAILTGNTILAVLLDAWILLSLPAVGLIGQTLGQQYLNHWSSSGPLEWMCAHTSPIIQYLSMGSDYARYLGTNRYDTFNSAMPTLVAVLILTLLFLGISRTLFLHRKSERSGTALAFEGLKLPIKCYMVLMIAFVFGIVFQGIGGDGWIWFGLLAGIALGHILIEILYHFDLRAAFAHWKTMIVLAVAAALILLGVQHDVIGYDKWVPDENKVASAGFITGLSYSENGYGLWDVSPNNSSKSDSMLTDPENIAAIRKLAEIGISSENEDGVVTGPENEWSYLDVYYRMTNGRLRSRSYSVPNNSAVWALLDSIRFSEEYRNKIDPLFTINLDDIQPGEWFVVYTGSDSRDALPSKTVRGGDQVRALLEAMREDASSLTPETRKTTVPVLRIEIQPPEPQDDDERTYQTIYGYNATAILPVYPSYTRTLALLASEGVQPQALTTDALTQISVVWENSETSDAPRTETEPAAADMDIASASGGSNSAVIRDPAVMQQFLQNAVPDSLASVSDRSIKLCDHKFSDSAVFFVSATLSNGNVIDLFYPEDQFPLELCQTYQSANN